MPDVPKFEQVKEFLKNASDDHILQMEELICLKKDIIYQRQVAIRNTIKDFYPEFQSLWERGKGIAAIKILRNWGWNNGKSTEQFSLKDCKDALEEEFGCIKCQHDVSSKEDCALCEKK